MPKPVKGTTEEREKFMYEVFDKFYRDPANAGQDLSVSKANEMHIKKFGSMLRNKKAYQIRSSVKAQVHGKKPNGERVVANREPQVAMTVPPGSPQAAILVEGSMEQLQWFQNVLGQLKSAGLSTARVDHAANGYLVVAKDAVA